jgi:two-component system, cell cycle sensor histidine kinase and response regulator CckA
MYTMDLLEQMPALVLATDNDGKVTFANTRLLSFIGESIDAVVGRSILAVAAASLPRAARRAVFTAMATDDERPVLLSWAGREGTLHAVEVVIAPRHDSEGRRLGHIAIGLDLTEARRQDEHLARARRMEAIGRFSGGVAHAINNTLTVVMGSVEIATQRLRHGESPEAELSEIMQAGRKTTALVRQLKDAGGRGQPPSAPLDLSRLVASLVPTLDRVLGAGIVVQTALQDETWEVRADAAQMEQVLMSLAVNAREAMTDGGRLSIATENRPAAQRGQAPCCWDAGREHVALRVRDTGRGMNAETLGRIFEPFFTTKKAGGSAGMGLATSYGIVQRCGGCIEVDSAPGRGTEVRILLPRFAEQPLVNAAAGEAAAPAGRGERVLVVDDDATLLRTIAAVLGRHGYQVATAATAEVAMQLVASGPHRFDLLVVDLILPGMTGVELRDRLLSSDPALKVLMMSGCREDIMRGITTLTSAGAFLQKPFGNATLLSSVRESLDGGRRSACG